ncbi:MAG: alpha/beta fold hydrolase, partial [Nocardiopsis sp. BM-2018]
MEAFPGPEHQPYETGAGPATAVVVHGFPGTPAEVRPVALALAAIGWRVRAPLLPGFGAQWSTLGERRWSEWRAAVAREAAVAAERGGPVLLVGFSMGAALVLAALADEDATADGVVLIAPFTYLPDRRAFALPLVKRFVREFRPYAGVDFGDPHVRSEVLGKVGDADLDDPAVRERLRTEVTIPTSAVDEVRRVGRHAYRVAPSLPRRPTLVVQGQRDTTVLPRTTVDLLRRLPGAPLRLFLPDADHRVVLPGRPG